MITRTNWPICPKDKSAILSVIIVIAFLLIFFISYDVFIIQMFSSNLSNDLRQHVLITLKSAADNQWYNYTIFYRLLYALTPGQLSYEKMGAISVLLLSLAVTSKAIISAIWIGQKQLTLGIVIGTIFLILAMPIYNPLDGRVYLGQITPSIWHNSTLIISYPAGFLFFIFLIKAAKSPSWKLITLAILTAAASILCKPSFAMAIVPAACVYYGISVLCKRYRAIHFITILGPVSLATICAMLFNYKDIYGQPDGSNAGQVILDPGSVWGLYSSNITLSILLSLLFPIAATIAYFDRVKRDDYTLVAWLSVLAGIAQYYLFAEAGTRFAHANFSWAASAASSVLFLSCTAIFVRVELNRRAIFVGFAGFLHGACGVWYLARIFESGGIWNY